MPKWLVKAVAWIVTHPEVIAAIRDAVKQKRT
jgi:hypothetical protein